ncbi:MAG: radical SAM protein [Candidatus Schekmanbacteria bacterium]|nr:radical SAM protein [Candidatus Schekmanbacteria bacterium]
MLLELKDSITYGPVRSRRLGSSLGINILPARRKTCTFDCIYCQYGFAPSYSAGEVAGLVFPHADAVFAAVAERLATLPAPPEYLTFSGNGEPTLHPDFAAIARGVASLRDRLVPSARTAILSNASTVGSAATRAGLQVLDERIMKLDAGNSVMFSSYDRPHASIGLEEIVAALAALGRVTIQALFAGGPRGNLAEEHVGAWTEAVRAIRPVAVQVYTLARPVPSRAITAATPAELDAVAARLTRYGIAAEVY